MRTTAYYWSNNMLDDFDLQLYIVQYNYLNIHICNELQSLIPYLFKYYIFYKYEQYSYCDCCAGPYGVKLYLVFAFFN